MRRRGKVMLFSLLAALVGGASSENSMTLPRLRTARAQPAGAASE